MNILITGGAGFIGSHLAHQLLKTGNRVEILDNLSTGRLGNIESFSEHEGYNWTHGSILDYKILDSLIEKTDLIYHLAASVGVDLVVNRLVET